MIPSTSFSRLAQVAIGAGLFPRLIVLALIVAEIIV
jgi:hypothetical protein